MWIVIFIVLFMLLLSYQVEEFNNYKKSNVDGRVFYENCKLVFDRLDKQVDGKTYCIFFPNEMSNVNVIYKSNYWMTLLLFDYFKPFNI